MPIGKSPDAPSVVLVVSYQFSLMTTSWDIDPSPHGYFTALVTR